ncbi:M16 family metallopeptidase [Bordetella sp. 02P26C-1]|uniref:M16 family metallopeptidase n=1 Tax=Bordetella sp. 02P26C-1 TaxID=2683195 RepID=UPI001353AD84|nr:pitrilysin family protein [Bordetella sp. 02P26C-1]MVW77490.1 insulinase family protein [Bordetella sp. 02P26C-1]
MRLSLFGLGARFHALLVTSFLAFHVGAATLPAGMTEVTSVEGITEYRLANGLRVLLAPDASKPTTTVNMTYLVGSRHENYGETGMAHLLEHMLFKGTPTTRNALGEFSKRGLQANGSTSGDRTNYFASFAADPETLKWYLGWQADAMVNSTISREDLDSEMTVVRNEMESGENSPFRVLMQKMMAAAFQWHNYGKSTIGARSDVENVDIAQLRKFYHEYYQPDNAVLIVSGSFDPQTTLEAISETLGKLPKPDRALPPEYTVEPVQDGERSVTLRRAGGTPLVAAMYHIPAAGSPEYAPFDLATMILSDTPSGRLYHALVPKKLAADVFGFAMDQEDPGLAMFGAQLQPGMNQDEALQTLTTTLESIKNHPFTQAELDRARSKWLTAWQQLYSDPENLGVALSESIAAGDWRLFFLHRDRVRDARLEDVQDVAVKYLKASNRTEGRYIPTEKPDRAPLLTRPDLSAALKDYKGDPDFKQAEAFDPSPANIDKLTQRETLNLPNGPVEVALLPKATRGGRVQAELLIQFGDATTLRGQRVNASTVADLLERGTPTLTRQAIQDRFDALQADVSFNGAGTTLTVSMSTAGEHLPALVDLVLDVVRHASFPEAEVEEYQRQAVTSIRSAMNEPSALARRALARHDNVWPVDDVRYVPTYEEELKEAEAIKRDELVAFHKRFYGAGAIKFAAVGEFDPAAVKQSLTKGLNGWQKAPAFKRLDNPYRDIKPENFDIDTPDKANAFFISRMPLKLQDTDADFPALYLANFLLGTSETSRLWNRVREQEGLSYNVRSNLSVSAYEPSGSWTMYAIYAPQNRERLEKAIQEELARATKDGFTEQEVRDGIAALLNYRKLSRAQDGVLASTWIDYMSRKRTFEWSAAMDEKIAALTADQVNAAVRKYLQPAQFSTAVAGDFSVNKAQ